jgi:hypothetical protein
MFVLSLTTALTGQSHLKVVSVAVVEPSGGTPYDTVSFGLSTNGTWGGGVHNNDAYISQNNTFIDLTSHFTSPDSSVLGVNNLGNVVGSDGTTLCSSGQLQGLFAPYLYRETTHVFQFLNIQLGVNYAYSGFSRSVNDNN